MIELDVETADSAELVAARDRIIAELRRRETLANAGQVIDRELREYKRAAGRSDGQPWHRMTVPWIRCIPWVRL